MRKMATSTSAIQKQESLLCEKYLKLRIVHFICIFKIICGYFLFIFTIKANVWSINLSILLNKCHQK